MLYVPVLLVAAIGAAAYITILPVFSYFYDRKGLRKYPNFSPLSGLTNLRHVYLSSCGYRSRDLYEAHKRSPILRTGPNSLSFSHPDATRDIYGQWSRHSLRQRPQLCHLGRNLYTFIRRR